MFKDNLRNLRISKDLTQEQLSKNLGLSPSSIGNYEQGTRFPKYETLEKIADYFNISISDLFLDSDNQQSLSPLDREIVNEFMKLDENDKKDLLNYALYLLSKHK